VSGRKRKQLNPGLLLLFLCLIALGALLIPLAGDLDGLPGRIEGWINEILSAFGGTAVPEGVMEVHFIDVGQGDAIFISTASQKILVDAGERGDTVANYLRQLGVKRLDLVVGTHPHSDHIGGLVNVLRAIPVSEVMDPGVVHTSQLFEEYLTIIDEKNIKFTEARAGIARKFEDGLSLIVLHPRDPSSSSLNNASIVLKITFGRISFLLAGDAEEAAEKALLASGYSLRSTVLKVGHHGSATGSSADFIRAVSPAAAVITVGENNRYGHPDPQVLDRLKEYSIEIFRTDHHSTIIIITEGKTIEVILKKEAA
jgi:competence protein ComEC